MGLFVRIVPTTGAIAVTADGATYASCGDTEIALFVGKTGPTARMKGVMIQDKVRKMAHQLARRLPAEPGVKATADVTVGVEVADDKVTIDGTDFTLKVAAASNVQVTIGATKAETALNLRDKINAHGTVNAKVWASIDSVTPEKVNLVARRAGTAANAYTLAETGTTFTISGATFANGTVARKSALLTPPAGTTYAVANRATATAVTESTVGLVWGQTAWASAQKSRNFMAAVEKLLKYFKAHYGRVA